MYFLLWLLLLVIAWPVAILALLLYPLIWLICIPFRVLGAILEGFVALIRSLFMLPSRAVCDRRCDRYYY